MAFTLQTTAFKDGETIPVKFTCDDADVSPALSWNDPPEGTKSLCLVVDDPDAPAGLWTHWLLWNLPDSTRVLGEGLAKGKDGPEGSSQGSNDSRKPGYGGPCPPPGPAHRYFFRLHALDGPLDLAAGATRKEFDQALAKRKILGTAELMARYTRRR